MNQSQWAVLDAMGISCWQRKQPGEIAAPMGRVKHATATDQVHFVILVNPQQVVAERTLFQSILTAVGWPASHYRVLKNSEELQPYLSPSLQLVWSVGEHSLPQGPWKEIESPTLSELASNPKAKAALWQQLQPFRCD